ncbi:unnamed protein product [Alopecurus aequalis]
MAREDDGQNLCDIDESPPIMKPAAWTPQVNRLADEEKSRKQQTPQLRLVTMEKEVSMAIPQGSVQPPTICEVPGDLAEGNKGAYSPKVVCIGPLFDGERTTASMLTLEHYKRCCVRKLVVGGESAAWSPEVHGQLLRNCFDTIMRLVPQIRASYSSKQGQGAMSDDEQLAITMLLDGCFVLYRLLKHARRAKSPSSSSGGGAMESDYDEWTHLFGRCWVWGTVKRDLLLLTNQVPFFVLRKLFKHLRGNTGERDDTLVSGGLHLFGSLHPQRLHSAPIQSHDVHHLLHLFYLSVDFPPSPSLDLDESIRQQQQQQQQAALLSPELTRWVPCATELEEAGVRFCARKRGALSFLDVRFRRRRGILEIPPLQLFDYSEPLFRNLIAFEQTYPTTPGRITAYAIFMDCLVKTTGDVRLLHRSGVLVNHMNGDRDDAAMGFFSRLCKEAHTSDDRNYLAGLMQEVNTYQRARWPRWRAALVSNYFTNPWVTTSVVVAVVLLAMTVLQTFYSVYGYYKPLK